jgi:glycosyltransferase involved in cell wall biosynthesis
MACRCPVLLSDIPSHREIARGTDFIPLCPPGDAAAFSRQIRRFLKMAPSERAAIGQKCRRLVEDRFQISRMLDAYENLYRDLLDRRAAGGGGLPRAHPAPCPHLCASGNSR